MACNINGIRLCHLFWRQLVRRFRSCPYIRHLQRINEVVCSVFQVFCRSCGFSCSGNYITCVGSKLAAFRSACGINDGDGFLFCFALLNLRLDVVLYSLDVLFIVLCNGHRISVSSGFSAVIDGLCQPVHGIHLIGHGARLVIHQNRIIAAVSARLALL